jgi:hypothetical protein
MLKLRLRPAIQLFPPWSRKVSLSWQVTGVRQDAYAKANPLQVEVQKPANERGYHIHPELYGAPPERSIEWARDPGLMRELQEGPGP